MVLTGPADGAPLTAPAAVASIMEAAADDLARQTGRWGRPVTVDGPALLGERAAITGMTRAGSRSVGGSAEFVAVRDGWVALNLPRPEDVAALPALVGEDVRSDDWPAIRRALAALPAAAVVEQAAALGLAVGAPGPRPTPGAPVGELHRGGPRVVHDRPLVIDMGSLWAGPLAGQLLAEAGARVIKVEGRHRPDGGRRGAVPFFDLLNEPKECVAVDLADRDDRRFLRRLLAAADLVIEGSRPRVMEELGVDPAVLASAGTSWLSITGHGRTGPAAMRVGFGDDAAAEGGLVVAGDPPMFVADAVADPIAGLVGAAFAAEVLAGRRAAVIEAPLARVAAWAARTPDPREVVAVGDDWVVRLPDGDAPVAPPRHRPLRGAARPVGADDSRIRAEFGASTPDGSDVTR